MQDLVAEKRESEISFIDLSHEDIKFANSMLRERLVLKCERNARLREELLKMLQIKKKAEIQALSSISIKHLSQELLPRKIKNGEWL